MVIKCPNCGNWTEGTSRFCPVCGTSLMSLTGRADDSSRKAPMPNPIEGRQNDIRQENVFEPTQKPTNTGAQKPQGQTPVYAEARNVRQNAGWQPAAKPPKKKTYKVLFIVLGAFIIIIALMAVLFISFMRRIASMSSGIEPNSQIEEIIESDENSIPDEEADPDGMVSEAMQNAGLIGSQDKSEDSDPESAISGIDTDVSAAKLANAGYTNLKSLPTVRKGQTLLDENGVIITVTGIGLNEFNVLAVGTEITNNSDQTVVVDVPSACLNTYEVNVFCYAEVPPHTAINSDVEFFTTDVNITGITNIGEVRLAHRVLKPDTFDLISEVSNRIETSDFAVMDDSANDEGYEIGNQNGVRLVAKSVEKEDYSKDQYVYFYAKNETDQDVVIFIENVRLNGKEFPSTLYLELPPGTQAVSYMSVYADDLSANGVSQIDEMSFHPVVYDKNTYDVITDFGIADLTVTYE